MNRIKVIAYYLPQFHSIPENDEWWGNGFTEWTNVKKATPLFTNHTQPRVPGELGYYNLLDSNVRQAQADLANEAGVFGFCYWHYWFGNGKRLIEKPFKEVLASGKPDFPFCLGWANESWKAKVWGEDKFKKDRLLIEQLYPGDEDYLNHFNELLPAFLDQRYIKVENRPLFLIYKPELIPDLKHFTSFWNSLAKKHGFGEGLFFVARIPMHQFFLLEQMKHNGVDAITVERISATEVNQFKLFRNFRRFIRSCLNKPLIIPYKKAINSFGNPKEDCLPDVFPALIPNWDHSPRSGKKATILHESNPALFKAHAEKTFSIVNKKVESRQIVFLKSWNEWGEGNYMEPDQIHNKGYIHALREALNSFKNR